MCGAAARARRLPARPNACHATPNRAPRLQRWQAWPLRAAAPRLRAPAVSEPRAAEARPARGQAVRHLAALRRADMVPAVVHVACEALSRPVGRIVGRPPPNPATPMIWAAAPRPGAAALPGQAAAAAGAPDAAAAPGADVCAAVCDAARLVGGCLAALRDAYGQELRTGVSAVNALWQQALTLPGMKSRALPAAVAHALLHALSAACHLAGSDFKTPAQQDTRHHLAERLLEMLSLCLHADALRARPIQPAAPRAAGAGASQPQPAGGGGGPCGFSLLELMAGMWARFMLRAAPRPPCPRTEQRAEALLNITIHLQPGSRCLTPVSLALGVLAAARRAWESTEEEERWEAAALRGAGAGGPEPAGAEAAWRRWRALLCRAAGALEFWAPAADALAEGLAQGLADGGELDAMRPAAAAAAAAATADALAWPLEALLEEARAWCAWRASAREEDGACSQTPAARREHKAAVRKARAAAAKAAAAEAEAVGMAVDSCEIRLRPLAAWARLCGAAADAAEQRPGDMRKCRPAKVAQRLGALLQPWLSDQGILDPGMHHRPPVEGAGGAPAPGAQASGAGGAAGAGAGPHGGGPGVRARAAEAEADAVCLQAAGACRDAGLRLAIAAAAAVLDRACSAAQRRAAVRALSCCCECRGGACRLPGDLMIVMRLSGSMGMLPQRLASTTARCAPLTGARRSPCILRFHCAAGRCTLSLANIWQCHSCLPAHGRLLTGCSSTHALGQRRSLPARRPTGRRPLQPLAGRIAPRARGPPRPPRTRPGCSLWQVREPARTMCMCCTGTGQRAAPAWFRPCSSHVAMQGGCGTRRGPLTAGCSASQSGFYSGYDSPSERRLTMCIAASCAARLQPEAAVERRLLERLPSGLPAVSACCLPCCECVSRVGEPS